MLKCVSGFTAEQEKQRAVDGFQEVRVLNVPLAASGQTGGQKGRA